MILDPYNAQVRALFANTAHAGSLADAASVSANDQGVHLELSATSRDGLVGDMRFRIRGCPHLIAATEAVCAEYEGQAPSELDNFLAADLMQSLAVPAEKSGRILVLEDTVRMLGAALRDS